MFWIVPIVLLLFVGAVLYLSLAPYDQPKPKPFVHMVYIRHGNIIC